MDILRTINQRRTPQVAAADPRQVRNSAGGFTFELDDRARLRRFLTLGVDGGTYHTCVVTRLRVTTQPLVQPVIHQLEPPGSATRSEPRAALLPRR